VYKEFQYALHYHLSASARIRLSCPSVSHHPPTVTDCLHRLPLDNPYSRWLADPPSLGPPVGPEGKASFLANDLTPALLRTQAEIIDPRALRTQSEFTKYMTHWKAFKASITLAGDRPSVPLSVFKDIARGNFVELGALLGTNIITKQNQTTFRK
jgi:hypothetical protein